MAKTKYAVAMAIVAVAFFATGCDDPSEPEGTGEKPATKDGPPEEGDKKAAAPDDKEEGALVVYCARSKKLVDPLIEKFEKSSGIKVEVRYGDATNLVTKIRTEAAQTDADVFFAQDLGHLGVLRDGGALTVLPPGLIDQSAAPFREASKTWVAVSGRLRVLVYSPERVKVEDLPKTLKDLADPKWKGKLGWAPRNGSFLVHVSALRAIWGEEETEKWLTAMKALEPAVYPKNSPQVNAVDKGEIDIGWVNHYYLHSLKKANPKLAAANHSFPTAGDGGNILMLSGAAVMKASKRPEKARKFVEFLISEAAQEHFAQKVFEYPTRPGVKTHPDLTPIDKLGLAKVEQTKMTDIAPTIALLQKLGLQ